MIKALKKIIPTNILLTVYLFAICPFVIFHGNIDEFTCGLSDIPSYLALPAILFFLFYIILGLIFLKKIDCYIAVGFAIGILAWVEGTFFLWDYGVFDGRGIDWEKFTWQGWMDISIWCLILLFAFILSKNVNRFTPRNDNLKLTPCDNPILTPL